MRVTIGSVAARANFPDFPRDPADLDVITDGPKEGAEVHHAKATTAWFTGRNGFATPDELYTIKASHSFWDVHWEKTMADIRFFQSKGCKIRPELFDALYSEWEVRHGKKNAHLTVTNERFFSDHVDRVVDHDWLHEQVMYYDAPMFKKLKTDKGKAMISRRMFEALSHEDQVRTCREEIKVVSVERHGIPSGFTLHPRTAYTRAAKDLIVYMTKGWFPRFIVENWLEMHMPDENTYYRRVRDLITI